MRCHSVELFLEHVRNADKMVLEAGVEGGDEGAPRSTIPAKINSNDFVFLELISRFEFEFRHCGVVFFVNDSNFWCVQSSITCNESVHVPVLRSVCTQTIPVQKMVSVTIHDNMFVYIHVHVHVHVYVLKCVPLCV